MSGIIFGGGATIDLTSPPTSIGTTTPVAVNSTIFSLNNNTFLASDGANIFAQRNATTTQTKRLYKSFTDPSNYTRAAWQFDANGVVLATESAGTGEANISITLIPKGNGSVIAQSTSTSATTLTVKAIASQTSDLQQWRDSSGSVLARITASGTFGTGYGEGGLKPKSIISGVYAGNSAMAVNNYFGHTVGYIHGDNSGNFHLLDANADRVVTLSTSYCQIQRLATAVAGNTYSPSLTLDATSGDEVGFYLPSGLGGNALSIVTDRTDRMVFGATGNVLVGGFTASTVGLTLKAAPSQTANIQEWQNNSNTILLAISASGNLVSNTTNGIKIGTTTSQKLGFFNATPVVQQTGGAATAGVAYTATEQAMLQKVYDTLRTLGFLS